MAITNAQQAKQLLALGGRIGLQGGGRDAAQADFSSPAGQDTSGDTSREDRRAGQYTSPEGRAVDRGIDNRRAVDRMKFGLRRSISPTITERARDFLGRFGPDFVDEEDEENRGGPNVLGPLGFAASAMNPMTPQQGIGALDLNRIAYRFMADGGFLEDTDEARQAYGLGSIVKKAFKTVRKPFKAVTKTLKKVAKSPTGRLLLAVAAPYALGPAMAQASFLQGLTAAQQAALISGATTGITQLATGQDLDFKDIALSAAIGGVSASAFPPGGAKPGVDGKAFNASRTSAGKFQMPRGGGADFSNIAASAPTQASRLSGIQDYGSAINVASPVGTSVSTSASTAFRPPTMKDVGVTGMPSVKPSLSESLLASSRRGLSKAKDLLIMNKDRTGVSPLKIASLAGLAGLATAKGFEEQTPEEQDRGEGIDIAAIRRRPFDFLAPRFAGSQFDFYAAEGGQAKKEPVAKKVMPLLDMGGMEKDYRAEGGFVPIGRMEKADDVPARLSKNEFVFTADAVRNAGDGDVDKGAEVMYNMMKNLEAGGDVSEESQGLEGARRMFQTSQRLEEVL